MSRRFDGILFDFDGVLIQSEYAGNAQIAAWLTDNGHPTTTEQSMHHFMGLSGAAFTGAVERWIGGPLPKGFATARAAEDARIIAEGVPSVAGAITFVESLPADWPCAIVSSSRTHWIDAHLRHIGLRDRFGDHLYSGHEHVEHGKPAPDLYLYAAIQIGVPIERLVVIEDSPVGAKGAVASGAYVIGLCAGSHCLAGHDQRLRDLGVDAIAHDFDEVARLLSF